MKELLWKPSPCVRRILITAVALHAFQHLCGNDAILLYSQNLQASWYHHRKQTPSCHCWNGNHQTHFHNYLRFLFGQNRQEGSTNSELRWYGGQLGRIRCFIDHCCTFKRECFVANVLKYCSGLFLCDFYITWSGARYMGL